MTQEKETGEPDRQTPRHLPHREWLQAYPDQQERDRVRSQGFEARWSIIRLIVFVAGVAGVVLLRRDLPATGLAGTIAALVFAGAIWQHTKWQSRRTLAERLLIVVEESLHATNRRDRPARSWQRPEDPTNLPADLPVILEPGPTWPLSEQEQDDLDLYGPPVGVFGLLNRTSTALGARRLRDMLDRPCLSGAHIQRRQQAVGRLDKHNELRFGLMATLVPLRSHSEKLDRMVRLLHTTERPPRSVVDRGARSHPSPQLKRWKRG
ncbi:MAG: hypothetical protein FJ280_17715 [Planctomycetes bacterium]|nr:hypothetical protein [Planctomycetota bacterium]